MALAAATSCGGAIASKREVPPGVAGGAADSGRRITDDVAGSVGCERDDGTMVRRDVGYSAQSICRNSSEKGIRFAYRAFGRKPGVPLLLLAPLRGTMDSWDPRLTDAFAQDRPLILFDTVGVGLTGGDARTTVAEMATDAGAFIDALRELHFTDADWFTGHVDVLGFSLGGFVAQQLAMNRPDVVERVVLAATAPQGGEGLGAPLPEVTKSLLADPQTPDDVLFLLFARSEHEQGRRARLFLRGSALASRDRDGSVSAKAIPAQMRAMKALGQRARRGRDLLVSLGHQATSARRRWRGRRRDADEQLEVLAQNLPSARLVIYPDSAQGFLFQYPDAFAKDVTAFLRRP